MNPSTLEKSTASSEKNQEVLWSGTPVQGILFQSADYVLIPVAVAIDVAILFYAYRIIASTSAWYLILLSPFIWVGYYMTIGRFRADAKRRRGIFYELTSSQLIIHRQGNMFTDPISIHRLSAIPNVVLQSFNDGTGTILFLDRSFNNSREMRMLQKKSWRQLFYRRSTNQDPWVSASIDRIFNAKEVYSLIQDRRQKATLPVSG